METPTELLYRALSTEYGILVETSDREKFKMKLYAARREAKDPDLDCISIVLSSTSASELWIVKRPSK